MGMSVGSKGGVKSDINVTPLVDIMLVLLIIFIIVTPAVNNSVKLPLAKHSPKVDKASGAVYLTVYYGAIKGPDGEFLRPGAITIDDNAARQKEFSLENAASAAELGDWINKSVSSLEDKRIFVKADAEIPFKYINMLFQLARKNGADEASIVTNEGEDKRLKEANSK